MVPVIRSPLRNTTVSAAAPAVNRNQSAAMHNRRTQARSAALGAQRAEELPS
jgi:hypothetical protein